MKREVTQIMVQWAGEAMRRINVTCTKNNVLIDFNVEKIEEKICVKQKIFGIFIVGKSADCSSLKKNKMYKKKTFAMLKISFI